MCRCTGRCVRTGILYSKTSNNIITFLNTCSDFALCGRWHWFVRFDSTGGHLLVAWVTHTHWLGRDMCHQKPLGRTVPAYHWTASSTVVLCKGNKDFQFFQIQSFTWNVNKRDPSHNQPYNMNMTGSIIIIYKIISLHPATWMMLWDKCTIRKMKLESFSLHKKYFKYNYRKTKIKVKNWSIFSTPAS